MKKYNKVPIKKCKICNREFKATNYNKKGCGKFCSRGCFGKSQIGKIPWNKNVKYTSEIKNEMSKIRKGKHYSPNTQFKKGATPWNKNKKIQTNSGRTHFKKGVHLNVNTEFKKGMIPWNKNMKNPFGIPWNKGKEFLQIKGNKHPNWKGGITSINCKERNALESKRWRIKIFKRDNFICQICNQKGGKLCAHHIKTWSKFKKLRLDVNNGITVCKKCHKIIHKNCKSGNTLQTIKHLRNNIKN